jgi:casein kinase I family protein HRR25
MEQSRRDDLESLAYILLYFLSGSLPWYGAKASTKRQRDKITQMKRDLIPDPLIGWPNEFRMFLDYTRTLHFEEKPDYAYLRKLFRDLCIREGYQYDGIFDWCLPGTSSEDQIHQTASSTAMKTCFKENVTAPSRGRRMFVQFSLYRSPYALLTMT